MKTFRTIALLLFAASLSAQTMGTISTYAGGGTGDGKAAVQAFLNLPYGLAFDVQGNLLIVDQGDNRIRKVDKNTFVISTFAGTGLGGYVDGPSAQAQFNFPTALRVDGLGNVYFTDVANRRVRKIDTSGNVTTFAGSGSAGDPASAGPALSAKFQTIYGVAPDNSGDNVYISDSTTNRVVKVSGGNVSLVAGTGAAGFSGDGAAANLAALNSPLGLAVDSGGSVYIVDSSNGRIRKVTPDGTISTVAGCGTGPADPTSCPASPSLVPSPALKTRLFNPQDIAIGPDGIYILDAIFSTGQAIIWRLDTSGTLNPAGFLTPQNGTQALAVALAVDTQSPPTVYVADELRRVVVAITGGVSRTFAGGSVLDGGPANAAGLVTPTNLRVDTFGNVYIADSAQHRIRKIDSTGTIRTVAGNGLQGFAGDGGPATSASLSSPGGMAFDSNNNLYIADTNNSRIRQVSAAGVISTFAGINALGFAGDGGPAKSATLNGPSAVTVDSAGNVYIADRGNRRIRKVDTTGTITTFAGDGGTTTCAFRTLSCGDGGPATAARFSDPRDIALDAQGNLYVVDNALQDSAGLIPGLRIRKIDASTGRISTIAGNAASADATGDGSPPLSASIGTPAGIAIALDGTIFISDDRNHRIRRISATISTVAGTTAGFSGDGGPGVSAQLTRPRGLALDPNGNLLVADSGNNRIRSICCVAPPTPARMTPTGGDNQTAPVATTLSQSLTVAVLNGAVPVPNVAVTFVVDPASAADLNPASVSTDANGQASTKVTFKNVAGKVTVTAMANGLNSVIFRLTATPLISPGGAVNGASFAAGIALAPGLISSLFGQGMAGLIDGAASLPLPQKLATDTIVRVVGSAKTLLAPLYYASPGQINFLLPFEVSDPAVNLVLSSGGVDSPPLTVNVVDASPGIFLAGGAGIVLHSADNSLVTAASPAKKGEVLTIYCAGLGAVSPAITSGVAAPSDPLSRTVAIPTLTFGTVNAVADANFFSGLTPGFAGLYQINVTVPDGVTPGAAVPLQLTVGTRKANLVMIAVQ